MKVPKIITQTKDWIALDKPAGLVVHDVPGEKHAGNTLVDWFIKKFPEIKKEAWPDSSRPGIVHRLDAETSGVIVLAKNPETLKNLQKQFKARKTHKTYLALVAGDTPKSGEMSGNIVRLEGSTKHTLKTLNFPWDKGKSSHTTYERINCYDFMDYPISLVKLFPKTGRTHQLRVQLYHLGTPILGDKLYFTKYSKDLSDRLDIERHLLHASELKFTDSATKEEVIIKTPLSTDFDEILSKLHQRH